LRAVLGKLVERIEGWFAVQGRMKSLLFGLGLACVFILLGFAIAPLFGVLAGFLAYFPFHLWLTISLFLAIFSKYERERLVGVGFNWFTAIFGRVFGPYGLFCVGWFYGLFGGIFVLDIPVE
jgi:hypothetical protein